MRRILLGLGLALCSFGIGLTLSIPSSMAAGEASGSQGLRPTAGDVVNVRDFGAVGDDTHDDTDAINRAITHARTLAAGAVPPSYRQATTAVVLFPPGTYKVTHSINLTRIDSIAFALQGRGAVIDAHVAGESVLDAYGSRALKITGLGIVGSSTAIPTTGIQLGRLDIASKSACDDISMTDVTLDGSFSLAGLYVFACETSKFDKLTIWNMAPNGYAAIFDGINHFGVTSSFAKQNAPADTPQSFNEGLCLSCDFRVAAGTPIWFSSAGRFSFGTNSYAAGTQYGMVIYQSNTHTPAAVDLGAGIHFETDPKSDFFISAAPGKNFAVISGFHYLNNSDQATRSVFALDPESAVRGAELARADIRIASYGRGRPKMFDQPSKWSGSGVYVGPTDNDDSWNLPPTSWSGELCINRACMFQGAIHTPYNASFGGDVSIQNSGALKVGGESVVAPTFTRFAKPGTYTITQVPGSHYIEFELWGPGGPGGNGIACNRGASCSGAGSGGAGAHHPPRRLSWAEIGASNCTLMLPSPQTAGSHAPAGSTTMACNGFVTKVAGGGGGSNALPDSPSAGGGGGSLISPGANAAGPSPGAGGSSGGGGGGAGSGNGSAPFPYGGPGGVGTDSSGTAGVNAVGILASGSGGPGGGCKAGTTMPGGNGGATESSSFSPHGIPGVDGTTPLDGLASGGAGGDAAATGRAGDGGAGGIGAGGGGGGNICNGVGTPGLGGRGGMPQAIVWQG